MIQLRNSLVQAQHPIKDLVTQHEALQERFLSLNNGVVELEQKTGISQGEEDDAWSDTDSIKSWHSTTIDVTPKYSSVASQIIGTLPFDYSTYTLRIM